MSETERGGAELIGERLPAPWFARVDEEPDHRFYQAPRFVQHIDDGAIAVMTEAIQRWVAPRSVVLDLMSSWVSHLPAPTDLPLARVVGLGMNADELAANPRLDAWFVQDLNKDPHLPYGDGEFDAVLITVSVQYLTAPVSVFRQVARVLRPGGMFLVSFSNRMFPTKAVRIWQETPEDQRPSLVGYELGQAGGFREPDVRVHRSSSRRGGDPLWVVAAERKPMPIVESDAVGEGKVGHGSTNGVSSPS